MSDCFSEARRVFEKFPGIGTLEHGIEKLARAGVEPSRIRRWAFSITAEFGIQDYVRPDIERLLRGAAKLAQTEKEARP